MLRGELDILVAIALNKGTTKQITSSRIARSSSYVKSTIESLLREGYICGSQSKGYQITDKGAQAIVESDTSVEALTRLAHNRLQRGFSNKAKEAIKLIKKLGIDYDVSVEGLSN
jgi:predicted transcriptional regulator